jgi:hypothetical protein
MHNYEVIYDDIVIYKITVLIKSLKQSRIRRFEDSGLEELLLTSKYEEELDKF